MNLFTKEVKIGLAGIVTLVVLFFGIKFLKGIDMFKATNYYYVEFDNIGGLTQSSPVYADGYGIGIVRDITYNYNRPGHVVVEIEVDKAFRMPKGSRGELVTEMLGTIKMNLLLNKVANEWLVPGDTIPGRANGGLMEEAGQLVPSISQMLPKLDSICTSLNKLLADPALAATLHNAEHITANLESTTSQLNKMVNVELPQLTGNLKAISSNFVSISDNLKAIDYASTFEKVDSTLYNIRLFTEKLNSRDNTVGLLLNDPSMYNHLNATSANASALLEDLRLHPKRYVHFSLFGKKDK